MKRFLAISLSCLLAPIVASAAGGGIDPTYPYAWSEQVGWLNFGTNEGDVQVTDTKLTGYVWGEDIGWINLAPTPTTYVANDGQGDLSGYAWGAGTGYIDFSNTTIDRQGFFHGHANSSITGDISFNCDNSSSCGSSDFKVKTYWQPTMMPAPTPTPVPSGGGGGTKSDVPNLQNAPQNIPQNPQNMPGAISAPVSVVLPTAQPPANTAATILARRGIGEPTAASIPRFLFDISLVVDPDQIKVGDDVNGRVSLTSFGTERTPVRMLFSVIDKDGRTRRSEIATTSVETQMVFNQRMTGLSLEPGPYWLNLDVNYGTSSKESLSARFAVTGGNMCSLWWPFQWLIDHFAILAWFGCKLPWYLLVAFIITVSCWLIRHRYRRAMLKRRNKRKKYENW
ncbi:MAG TPA: hypothetical protein VHD69_02305 [Candidatus Paceibacterota bacterium]|nr:hypothetical protein [Candidatus Paceibacterota bacterium]